VANVLVGQFADWLDRFLALPFQFPVALWGKQECLPNLARRNDYLPTFAYRDGISGKWCLSRSDQIIQVKKLAMYPERGMGTDDAHDDPGVVDVECSRRIAGGNVYHGTTCPQTSMPGRTENDSHHVA
jgi:hypothetical protein